MRLGADPNVEDVQGLSAAKVAKSHELETKILIIKLADKRARAVVYHILHIIPVDRSHCF